jgi:enamine deaminase RidA (YjgF/YER057c/UK114 family)
VATPDGHFCQVAVVPRDSEVIFISGQVARGPDGKTVGIGDMTRQAEQVFENLRAILAHYGSDFSRAVKATIYVTDADAIPALMAVRSRYYGDATPASTLVVVSALGSPDWMLEIELVAAI